MNASKRPETALFNGEGRAIKKADPNCPHCMQMVTTLKAGQKSARKRIAAAKAAKG